VENDECVLLYELKCRIGFSHSVRSFDRQDGTKATVNDIRCYKFEIAGQQGQQPAAHQALAQSQPAAAPAMPAPAPFPPQVDANGNPTYDDLPF
jgi:hypothetical protein